MQPRRISQRYRELLLMSAAAALSACSGTADPEAPWPSDDIELIIPSGPGGGFDTYARILARAMEERLDVNVVPRNVSGGDGMRGATVAYRAAPDGHTFAIFNVPGIIEPIIAGTEVGYDVSGIDWLGAMALDQYVVLVAGESPYDTIADLQRIDGRVSFTAYGSSGIAANKALCAELALDCLIITGYPSNNEALLGVVRGDAIGSVPPIQTGVNFNRNGDLKAILLMTDREISAFAGTQTTRAAGYPELVDFGLVRAFGLPPGVPAEVRAQFAAVFDEALHADSVASWAASTGSPYDPMSAVELRALLESQTRLLRAYGDVIGR